MVRRFLLVVLLTTIPSYAFALEGLGPRVTVTGTLTEIRMTKDQAFKQEGATLILKASNGQRVTVDVPREAAIISEGRLSRKEIIPANLTEGMLLRIRGLRRGVDSLTASLIVIVDIQVNPALSGNGILIATGEETITVLPPSNIPTTYTLTNETEVTISLSTRGQKKLTLIGKTVIFTLNPSDPTQIRVLRISSPVVTYPQ